MLVTDLAAQHAENRAHRCSRIDVGSAGENVDVSELVFGPGRHGDVRFAEDQDACRSVGLERLNQLSAHGAAEQACGFPHTRHDLFRCWCGVSASGYVEDCMDHRLAVLARVSAPVLWPLVQANSKWSWRPSYQGTVVSAGRSAPRKTGEQARRLIFTVIPVLSLMISPGASRKRALERVGGGVGIVAGQAEPEGGGEGLGQDAQHDVQVDVEVDGGGQGVGAERLDDLREPLLDGHPAGVVPDQRLGGDLLVVGDDDGVTDLAI